MGKYIVVTATLLAACCVVLFFTAIALVWSQLNVYSQYGSFDFINYIEMFYAGICIMIPVCVIILWYWITDQIHSVREKLNHITEIERLRNVAQHKVDKRLFGESKY